MTLSGLRVELGVRRHAPAGGRRQRCRSRPAGPPPPIPTPSSSALDLTRRRPGVDGGTTRGRDPRHAGRQRRGRLRRLLHRRHGVRPVAFDVRRAGRQADRRGWSEPGAPYFAADGEATGLGGFYRLFVDPRTTRSARGHRRRRERVRPRHARAAREETPSLDQFAIAFDPETATVFARRRQRQVLSFRYDADAGGLRRRLASTSCLRARSTTTRRPTNCGRSARPRRRRSSPATRPSRSPAATVAEWDVETYPALETGGRNVRSVVRSSTGKLVATYGPILVTSARRCSSSVHGSATIEDTGGALVATDIPDTVADRARRGHDAGLRERLGRVCGREGLRVGVRHRAREPAPADARAQRRQPVRLRGGGQPSRPRPGLGAVAVDRRRRDAVRAARRPVAVYRDGVAVASIPSGQVVRSAGGDESAVRGLQRERDGDALGQPARRRRSSAAG